MLAGRSLWKVEGEWREESLAQAEVSESRLAVDLEREGDLVSIAARSSDGLRYHGDYRYREGSNSNGEVVFTRYSNEGGATFVGEWKESDKVSGEWILILAEQRRA